MRYRGLSIFFALTAISLGTAHAIGSANGKYCVFGERNSYNMLLARENPDGTLSFGLSAWTPTGNHFGVAGTARRTVFGWRYEADINSPDPHERCAVTISRTPDGTFRVATVEGARCETMAGHNAVLYGIDVFPPASRVSDAPASFTLERLMWVGCDRLSSTRPKRDGAIPRGERWTAVSTTAIAITGDVTFSPDRITFQNGKFLPLAPADSLPGFTVFGELFDAALFKVTEPGDPVLLHGNRLCGGPVTFIVLWKPTRFMDEIDRSMAVFSSHDWPSAARGPGFCGTFNYKAEGPS